MASPHKTKTTTCLSKEYVAQLLTTLEFDFIEYRDGFLLKCPVHQSEQYKTVLYPSDNGWKWKCWTRGCEQSESNLLIDLVASAQNISRSKAEKLIYRLYNRFDGFEHVSVKRSFINSIEKSDLPDYSALLFHLNIPSKYFLSRGISRETLTKFKVGDCFKTGRFYKRAVAPLVKDNKVVGATGRTMCDADPKWIFSPRFPSQIYFYGLEQGVGSIKKSKSVYLVEGAGDLWKMHDAGKLNSLAIFGTNLSEWKVKQLLALGVKTLNLCLDNDEAGVVGANKIIKTLHGLFDINVISYSGNDIGECPIGELKWL